MSELLDRCDAVLELVGDRAEAVVGVGGGESALTRFANSRIHQNVAEDIGAVNLKIIVDGRAASASTTRIDSEGLSRLVENTLEAARLRPPDPDWPGLAPPADPPHVDHWDDATATADPTARAAVVKDFVDAGGGLESAGSCSTGGIRRALANTAGLRVEGRNSMASLDGIQRTDASDANAAQTSTTLADLDGAAAGTLAAERARAAAEAVDIEPGSYEVVIEPSCVANILQFLSMAGFNAKSHLDGTSFAHLGEAQFDESISLWDDAADSRALGMGFDADGTPKARLDLVKDGVTTNLVHDRRTAARAGTESTGHAVGMEAFGAYPINLFLGEGSGTSEDLIAGMDDGLLVCDFWYTRILDPKTQVVTGLTRNGVFRVEGGEVVGAVRNMRFTQSFVSALGPGKVKAIGGDARLVGSMHVPSLHLAEWNFTGGAKG